MAWVLVVGLLIGLFAFSGLDGSAGAASAGEPAACADSATGHQVALPSGDTETFCYDEGATTSAVDPAISLTKTVGTDGDSCATEDAITVASGTEVFYCYTVANTGEVTVSVHDLEDDKLGTLLSSFTYELPPGGSTFVTASATIEADTVNIATWTASDGVTPAVAVDSASVLVGATATVPDAPSITGVTVAEGEATVTWEAPVDDGGSPITGYKVTPYVGAVAGTTGETAAASTSITVDGLINGTTYTFRVAAVNAIGTGAEASSSAVTPQWWLPWSSGPVAVTEMFTWMTGVAPSTSEQATWLADLDSGAKLPGDLVAALRVGSDATANVDPTVRLYSAYLTRIPDAAGLNFWLGRRRSGWTLSRISNAFASSSEFIRRYGDLTNREFVENIYTNVLERTGEEAGIVYWTNQLDSGAKNRGQVMINFSESNEYKNKQVNKTHAAVLYIHLLGKTPSVPQRDAVVADLVGGSTIAEIVRQLIHAPTFDDRAS